MYKRVLFFLFQIPKKVLNQVLSKVVQMVYLERKTLPKIYKKWLNIQRKTSTRQPMPHPHHQSVLRQRERETYHHKNHVQRSQDKKVLGGQIRSMITTRWRRLLCASPLKHCRKFILVEVPGEQKVVKVRKHPLYLSHQRLCHQFVLVEVKVEQEYLVEVNWWERLVMVMNRSYIVHLSWRTVKKDMWMP